MSETLKDRSKRKNIKTRAYKRKFHIPDNISSENITIDEEKNEIIVKPKNTEEYKELLMKVNTNVVKIEKPSTESLLTKIKRRLFGK